MALDQSDLPGTRRIVAGLLALGFLFVVVIYPLEQVLTCDLPLPLAAPCKLAYALSVSAVTATVIIVIGGLAFGLIMAVGRVTGNGDSGVGGFRSSD